MKGIAHFAIGVAAATCFPAAVQAAESGHPLPMIVGGVFGLWPDTLDFKFARLFVRHDITITPDPLAPDLQGVADAVAHAANRAHATQQPVTVKLNTIRLGPDHWQRYQVTFDRGHSCVSVTAGPVVNTSGQPIDRATPSIRTGQASLATDIRLDYRASTPIDILEGPSFKMIPHPTGVEPRFIPWHRTWSHSLVSALLLGLSLGACLGPLAGAIALVAMSAHILTDQLGFLGSSLIYPFVRERQPGRQWIRSDDAWANGMAVWSAALLILWNLSVYGGPSAPAVNPIRLALFGIALPVLMRRLYRWWTTRPRRRYVS